MTEVTNDQQEQTTATGDQTPSEKPVPTLEELLQEFEPTATATEPRQQKEQKPEGEADEIKAFMRRQMEKERMESIETGLKSAVETIKQEEDLADFDDEVIEGYLHAKGRRNPKFSEAFDQRDRNPDAWTRALRGIAKELAGKITPKSDSAKDDLEAARASVRGSSTTEPEPKKVDPAELNQMSDFEFEQFKRGLDKKRA